MFHLATSGLTHFLTAYGYRVMLLFVAIESMGIPFPGETMLLVAATYAGITYRLSPPLMIVVAASGAILGDNLGYWIGREGGCHLLRRYGRYLRLDERKVKLGQYLFHKHGGKVVLFGRFIAVLGAWAMFLAAWASFLLFNALGIAPIPAKTYWKTARGWWEESIYFLLIDRFQADAICNLQ